MSLPSRYWEPGCEEAWEGENPYDEEPPFEYPELEDEETFEEEVTMQVTGEYFYGNKIGEYGLKNGYVDYATLGKAVNHVLCNSIVEAGFDFEQVAGLAETPENEVFQWYITDENGAEILREAGEMVFYCVDMDMYIWGVTHFGTAWDYVLTGIKCNTGAC